MWKHGVAEGPKGWFNWPPLGTARERLMKLDTRPLAPNLGAEVLGIDPLAPIERETRAAIRAALDEFSVLLFRAPAVDDDQQIAFSEIFGPLEITLKSNPAAGSHFARQSNIDMASGEIIPPEDRRMLYQIGNTLWHSDSSYKEVPSYCSILSAREAPPEGGDTELASTRLGYAALDAATRARIEPLVVEPDIVYSRGLCGHDVLTDEMKAETPPTRHRLVRVNPANGRRSMLIGAHASHIVGWPKAEGRELLAEMLAVTTRPEHCLSHRWGEGDIIVWDNRACLHRATPYDAAKFRRLMQRTTVAGTHATIRSV